jgi:hypothetical protein
MARRHEKDFAQVIENMDNAIKECVKYRITSVAAMREE